MAAKYLAAGMEDGNQIHVRCIQVGSATDAPADLVLGTDSVPGSNNTSDNNSTGTYPIFYVQPGIVITDVVVDKLTAFNSTGAMTMDIGDTDADGFWPNTDLIATDAGVKSLKTFISTAEGGSYPAYLRHRVYTSDDTADSDGWIAINLVVGTAKLNAGKANIYVHYFDKNSV